MQVSLGDAQDLLGDALLPPKLGRNNAKFCGCSGQGHKNKRPGEDSQKKFALHLSSEYVRYWNVRPNGDVLGKYFETPLFTATTTLLSKKKVI